MCTEFDLQTFPKNGITHGHLSDGVLGYVLVRRKDLQDVCITCAMRGADSSTDHQMIRSKLAIQLHVSRHQTARKPNRRLNVSGLSTHTGKEQLQTAIDNALCLISEEWPKHTANSDRI